MLKQFLATEAWGKWNPTSPALDPPSARPPVHGCVTVIVPLEPVREVTIIGRGVSIPDAPVIPTWARNFKNLISGPHPEVRPITRVRPNEAIIWAVRVGDVYKFAHRFLHAPVTLIWEVCPHAGRLPLIRLML